MSLSKYNNYINSDVDWLGEIPFHWEVLRLKDYIKINPTTPKNDKLRNARIEFLPMSNVDEITGNIKEYLFEEYEKAKVGYTAFKNEDVLFAKITPCMENGNCVIVSGLQNNLGFGSTEFIVFRANKFKILNKHVYQFLRNERFLKKAEKFMIGAAGQKRVSSEYLKTHPIAIPPLPEQVLIASFLDTKTSAIDRKVSLLEQKITHYQHLRKSLINQTVCRGLDKNVKLKDSGIEWIGMIPEHWGNGRLKDIGYLYSGLSGKSGNDFNQEENSDNKHFIPFTNIFNNHIINPLQLGTVVVGHSESQNNVKANDLFFLMSSEDYDGLGKTSLLDQELKETYLNSFCKGFRITKNYYSPSFLNYQLNSFVYRNILKTEGKGFTRMNLKMEKVNDLQIFFPDSISEQNAIATFLDAKTQKIDLIITNITAQIATLKELRKTLINDVVTGKLKVTE
jgi:type I restriction enzyme S subunit